MPVESLLVNLYLPNYETAIRLNLMVLGLSLLCWALAGYMAEGPPAIGVIRVCNKTLTPGRTRSVRFAKKAVLLCEFVMRR